MKLKKIILSVIGHVRVRPLCGVCILVLIAVSIYLASDFYKIEEASYSLNGDNIFKDNDTHEGDVVILKARVKSYCLQNNSGQAYLSVDLNRVQAFSNNLITGPFEKIKAIFPLDTKLYIGQSIEFEGKLKYYSHATNPGEFDSLTYYYSKGVLFSVTNCRLLACGSEYDNLSQFLYDCRMSFEEIFAKHLSREDAAIMKAVLCGNKNEIPNETKELFQKNGIAHILAISGLHISFLALTLYKLLKKIGLNIYLSAGISEAIILLYGIMVGFSVSAFRAICMFTLFLLGKLLKRSYDLMTAMSFALIVELLVRPGMLLDSGLKLSFMAVLGVGFFAKNYKERIWNYPNIMEAFFVSFWIFMATLPILAITYYEVAFYSIVLNLLIIPLMSILLLSGIFLLFLGTLNIEVFAAYTPKIIEAILFLYKNSCKILEDSGLGRVNIGSPTKWQLIFYYLLIVLAVTLFGFSSSNNSLKKVILSFFLCFMSILILSFKFNSGLNIWMLDVGQGDCMVIRNDNGNYYIIDGGSSDKKSVGERIIIPMLKFYGVNKIKGVFISHPDSDHMNGIIELIKNGSEEKLDVEKLYIFKGYMNSLEYEKLIEAYNGNEIIGIKEGDILKDGKLIINVLYPFRNKSTINSNDASLVMKISYGEFDIITTGDVEKSGEEYICKSHGLDFNDEIEMLKLAHHGSKTSSSDEFLKLLSPSLALISVGENSIYGHPHKETLKRLYDNNIRVFRTDKLGCIFCEVSKDGAYKIKEFN